MFLGKGLVVPVNDILVTWGQALPAPLETAIHVVARHFVRQRVAAGHTFIGDAGFEKLSLPVGLFSGVVFYIVPTLLAVAVEELLQFFPRHAGHLLEVGRQAVFGYHARQLVHGAVDNVAFQLLFPRALAR